MFLVFYALVSSVVVVNIKLLKYLICPMFSQLLIIRFRDGNDKNLAAYPIITQAV